MSIFFDRDRILVSNHKTDIEFAKKYGMKEMNINKEDASLEKITLEGIISSCENLLDDLEGGANINDEDMKYLTYTDNMVTEIQQRVGDQIAPSNIEGGFYSSKSITPYIDDGHGNSISVENL